MLKRDGKKRIKQIKFHFKDSCEVAVYDLDEEGKHIQLKNRAQRRSYKNADKNKPKPSKIPLDNPSTNLNIQIPSNSSEHNSFISNDLNEFFNFEEEYHDNKYDDLTEQLCYPLITGEDRDFLLNPLSDSDNFDFYAEGQVIEPINFEF